MSFSACHELSGAVVPAAVAPRRRLGRAFAAVLLAAGLGLSAAAPAGAAIPAPDGFADLAARLLPAVVNVSTSQTIQPDSSGGGPDNGGGQDNGGQDQGPPALPPGSPFEQFFKNFLDRQGQNALPQHAIALGSGFVIDARQGLVVTNDHVIKGADEISVTLHDNTTLKATVVGVDDKTDIALLRIPTTHPLTQVTFGDSDKVRVGDWVMAIGNPFGLGGTVTVGILSARARDINAGPYDDFLQTDASINKGNSGGPMFNMQGEVIGITTAIFSPSGGSVGIGFAIPSSMAKLVINQLREYGHTRRGWIGVRIQSVTPEIADSFGLKEPRGALVASATPDGPAAKAGLASGDIILSFDGKPINEMRELPRIVAETDIGRTVPITVWHQGKEISHTITVAELEAAEAKGEAPSGPGTVPKPVPNEAKPVATLGVTVQAITPDTRQQYHLEKSVKGVVVTAVKAGSPAADKGLQPGDVIVEISQEAVATPADVVAKVKAAQDSGKKSVLVLLNRQGDLRFVALALG